MTAVTIWSCFALGAAQERHQRGRILDRHGDVLAENRQTYDLMAEPRRFNAAIEKVVTVLQKHLPLSDTEISQRLWPALPDGGRRVEVAIQRHLSEQQMAGIRSAIKEEQLAGLRFVSSWKRYYPNEHLAAPLLGHLVEGNGVEGIEAALDQPLQPDTETQGADIILTIDVDIQKIVETELDQIVEDHRPKRVFALLAQPQSGEILAYAQRPAFNPNHRETYDPAIWNNRLATSGFEPGGLIKPLVTCAAMDVGVLSPDTMISCENGVWHYGKIPMRDAHPFGAMTAADVLRKGSNIGMAKIGVMMGEKQLYNALRTLKFGQPVNLGLPAEAAGILPELEDWDRLTITRIPIGYGILVTPLQIVQAYCALANDGVMPTLQVVEHIKPRRRGPAPSPAKKKTRIFNGKAVRNIVAAMRGIATDGAIGEKGQLETAETAGIPGTAQKVIEGQYSSTDYVASFVGFAPADRPEFVLLVAVDTPTKGPIYGGQVAAPAFKRIGDKALTTLRSEQFK